MSKAMTWPIYLVHCFLFSSASSTFNCTLNHFIFCIYAFPIVIESDKRSVFIVFIAFVTVLEHVRICSLRCFVFGTRQKEKENSVRLLIWYAQFAAIFFTGFFLLESRILRVKPFGKCFEKYVRSIVQCVQPWYLKYNIRSQYPNDSRLQQPHLRFLPHRSMSHCSHFVYFFSAFARNEISMKFHNNFEYCFKWTQNNCRQKREKKPNA